MMTISVRYCAQSRRASGHDRDEIALAENCAAEELLVHLARKHAGLQTMLLDSNGRAHLSVLLFVDGEQISPRAAHPLKNGDVVEILLPISGG